MTDYLAFSNKIKNRIAWVHSSYVTNKNFNKFYQNPHYVENLRRNRYAPLDKICFVSEDCKKEFIEVFGAFPKMEVIYNFIHTTEVLKKSTQQEIVPVEDFTFVAIGSLIPVKGYDVLIKAAALLKERGHSFKVRIVGRGTQEHQLKQMVETQGLSSFFQFDGFVSNPYPILKSADAFVMTSVSEANPTALCEALVLGKPSIVVNAPGCREIIGHGSFGIMTERTPEELANGMERVLVNPELREELKIKAKSRSKDFDDATVLSQYMKIFEE
jgi:glycosyltransferase involved in cell wall biosynthesis